MSITLKIIRYQGNPGEHGITAIFGRDGGNIGRADDNDLILVDPERYVSRHHAKISYENGNYYLTDWSTGGTFIDGNSIPLGGKTERLKNGMRLLMGEYELLVGIKEAQQQEGRPEPEILPLPTAQGEPEMFLTGTDSILNVGTIGASRNLLEDIPTTEADDGFSDIARL